MTKRGRPTGSKTNALDAQKPGPKVRRSERGQTRLSFAHRSSAVVSHANESESSVLSEVNSETMVHVNQRLQYDSWISAIRG